MHAVAARLENVVLVRRVITRVEASCSEDFEAVSEQEFIRRRDAGAFALDWQAHGLCYGIPGHVHDLKARGQIVLFNGSRAMLCEAANVFEGLGVLHVTANAEAVAKRLRARQRESEAAIVRRMKRVDLPLSEGLAATRIDNSGALEDAIEAMVAALRGGVTSTVPGR